MTHVLAIASVLIIIGVDLAVLIATAVAYWKETK